MQHQSFFRSFIYRDIYSKNLTLLMHSYFFLSFVLMFHKKDRTVHLLQIFKGMGIHVQSKHSEWQYLQQQTWQDDH